jgi:hypothetical protein
MNNEEKMRGATSRAAPCQGRGTVFDDLGKMPTGGTVASDFASDPFEIK